MLIRLLRAYLKRHRRWLTYVVSLQFVATIAALFLPSLNADIIDDGVAVGDTDYIMRVGAIMLAVTLVQVIGSVAAVYFGAKTAMGLGRDVRGALFDKVGSFSEFEVSSFGAPSLITRNTNDVQQVQMLVLTGCNLMVMAPIMMVGGVIMALREDVGLSWLVAVAVPILAAGVGIIIWRMMPHFRRMQEYTDDVNRVLREQTTGIRVIRAFVREKFETLRFDRANDDLTMTAIHAGRWIAVMFPTVMLVLNASSVAVLWFGGQRIEAGMMQVGSLTAFLAYLIQILMAVMMATFMFVFIPRAAVCARRIMEVLDTETSVVPPADGVMELSGFGKVDFESVEFAYPGADEPVLSDITFSTRPGETTAIVGSTGAGKTTLLNLIPRLFDVSSGVVKVNSADVRDIDPDVLWSRIGLVLQKAFLFSGTVRTNLTHGKPDADEEEMWAALEVAQAADFVNDLDGGLDASISQGGSNLSGGQRQRLAIARAVIRRPEIYLFDDSFSALDLATDARLRTALAPVTTDSTVIIVAQRVSTIRNADRIIVLEDGAIVGLGRHDDLVVTCPTYGEIVESQLTPEEAA
ncbi:MAG: ATP-binding cassette domain-containing protein [Acidimicrobiia bacterium]|nr:ATP-binding cassette domain-containing protein [Acidimicrobiia bacterium]